MSRKDIRVNARISAEDLRIIKDLKIGKSAALAVGITTLKLYVQRDCLTSCVYLYNTRENPAPPASAPSHSPGPIAQGCPCPACPLREAFGHLPHEKIGQKENVGTATQYPILKR